MNEEIVYGFDNNPIGVWSVTIKNAFIMPDLPPLVEHYTGFIDNTKMDDYMRNVVHQMD